VSFFSELQRRNVFRVTAAYVISAWLLAQVADLVLNNTGAPDWVMQAILLVLLLGLAPVVFFSWAYEVTPEGIKRESDVDQSGSITHITRRKLDRAITIVLVLAVAYLAVDKFMLDPLRDRELLESTADAVPVSLPQSGVKTIAVLPFVNMSDDADNEYFADGLSEELLNMLVKVPQLQVAARTSSFSFKGKDAKISDIARELNVSHVLEGSVRKSGDQLRITAQLIKADDGFHLWSETFDRTLDEIFVVQDEIAMKVTNALEVTLLGTSEMDVNADSYALYLRGIYFVRQRGPQNILTASKYLEEAVAADPSNYVAWASLAAAYNEMVNFAVITRSEGVPLVRSALDQALRGNPDDAFVRGAEGYIKKNLFWDWKGALEAVDRAYTLEPRNPVARNWRASLFVSIGRIEEAVRLYNESYALDPFSLSLHSSLGIAYTKLHRYDEAIELFSKQLEINPDYHWSHGNKGKAYLFQGDAERALIEIQKNPENIFKASSLPVVYHSLGRAAESDAALQSLISEYSLEGSSYFVATVYSWRGENDKAFEWLEKAYQANDTGIAYMLSENLFVPLLDDPRWPEFLEKVGLLEYWLAMPAEYGGPPA
jgi:TolB-like protein/Tfp pilus assembly protein PilF